jgi:putative ABC transport system permease protein
VTTRRAGRGLWLRWSWRDLRSRWAQVAAIAAIIALGTGIYVGFVSATEWRRVSYTKSYERLAMYDLRVQLAEGSYLDAAALTDAIARIPASAQLRRVEPRLVVKTQVDASTATATILVPGRIVGVDVADDGPRVNRIAAEEGRGLTAADAGTARSVLEYNFADYYDLPPRGEVTISGGHRLDYVGQGLSPEYFFIQGDRGSLFAEANFAVLFVPLDTAGALTGHPGQANDAVIALRPGADSDRVRAEITAALTRTFPDVGFDVVPQRRDEVRRLLFQDIDNDQRLYNVLAVLTLLGAAFAAFNLAGRMVEAQRREIGIGMALGVTPRTLAVRPLLAGVQIAALGAALGVLLGLGVGRLMAGVLQTFLPLPVWEFPFQWGIYVRGAALGLVLPFVAVGWPVLRAVRVTPLEAIRTGVNAPTRVSALARIPLPGRAIDQMPVRNVLRTPRRTALTALGIGAVISVVVGVVGMLDSFTATIDRTRTEILHGSPRRLDVALGGFTTVEGSRVAAVAALPEVDAVDTELTLGGKLIHDGTRLDVRLTLTDLDGGLWHPTQHDRVDPGDRPGIVITRKAADDLGVAPGDTVLLRHPRVTGPTSFEYVRTPIVVTAISPLPTRFTAFMDTRDASIMGLTGVTNSLQVEPAADTTVAAARRALFEQPGVSSVQPVRTFTDSVSDMLAQFRSVFTIIEGIVLLLALLIAFNSASINADERRRDHATMFAFGLPVRRVLAMAVVESACIGLLGTALGIAGGRLLLHWLINSLFASTAPDLGITVALAPRTLLIAAALGMIAVAVAPLLGARRIRNMDIPSTLRVVE